MAFPFFHRYRIEEEESLQVFLNLTGRLSRGINVIAGIAITFIMLLTVLDVILRCFRMPITGAYELVAFSGAIVVGFALPLTSFLRGHIYVDFLVLKLPPRARAICNGLTRCLGMGLFFLIGWNLLKVGADLHKSGEVSMTLKLPFYPVAYGVAFCCFVQCLVLASDLIKISRGEYDE
jgi:TRAP-type C4-dicarboxylate transport system permease small subunit